jgi:hypothetical protein
MQPVGVVVLGEGLSTRHLAPGHSRTVRDAIRGGSDTVPRRLAFCSPAPMTERAPRLLVPGYLPQNARAVLPWTRRYVAKLAAQQTAPLEDLWDEAIAALLREGVHYDSSSGYRFSTYACNSVIRGCWRYAARAQHRARKLGARHAIDETLAGELWAPSAEDEAAAREALRRAVLLREHAALATARGDLDTTTRLPDAATTAEGLAGSGG